jgi:hypothetical protein
VFAIGSDAHKGRTFSVLLKNRNVSRLIDGITSRGRRSGRATARLKAKNHVLPNLLYIGCSLDDRRVGFRFLAGTDDFIFSS